MMQRHSLRIAGGLLGLLLVSPDARATWSIVLADTQTREVGVACATCWDGQWLKPMMPVVRVGRGVANHQATWDLTGTGRQIVAWTLAEGLPPSLALERVSVLDPYYQVRQIGIADVEGRTALHTGKNILLDWEGGVHGQHGTLAYAISGNLLVGEEVVESVRNVVLSTPGDLAEKLMQGMLAAHAMGGDGRCSCNQYAPTACGSPPPSYAKSAHVGFMIVARPGDSDGDCTASGCATGGYYLSIEVGGSQKQNPDPVLQLQAKLDQWRQSWVGRPDHYQSEVEVIEPVLGSYGVTQATLRVRLVDWQGTPLSAGGAQVTVAKEDGSDDVVLVGPGVDQQDGSYAFPLTAKGGLGRDLLRVTVDDGKGPVKLHATANAVVANPASLAVTAASPKGSAKVAAQFSVDTGKGLAERPYVVLASLSGAHPGVHFDGLHVPLNPDFVTLASLLHADSPAFAGSAGVLDDAGRTSFTLSFHPGDLPASVLPVLTLALLAPGYASAPLEVPLDG